MPPHSTMMGLPPWPSAAWTQVPGRPRWLSYIRGPTSFLGLRSESYPDVVHRLYLGRPFQLDPDEVYYVRNRGFSVDGLVAGNPGNVANVITADAWASESVLDESDRRVRGGETVVVLGSAPVSGGILRARFRSTFSGAGATNNTPFKLSVAGLDRVILRTYNVGPDTVLSYVASLLADASGLYAIASGWYLSAGISITATNILASGLSRGYFAQALSTAGGAGVPLLELLSTLHTVTVSGGAVVHMDVFGEALPRGGDL